MDNPGVENAGLLESVVIEVSPDIVVLELEEVGVVVAVVVVVVTIVVVVSSSSSVTLNAAEQ